MYLLWFNFALKHVLEKSIKKADRLSKRLDWQERVENNNEDQILIKPGWIKKTETLVEEDNLREKIRKVQKKNKKMVRAVEELKKTEMKILKNKE